MAKLSIVAALIVVFTPTGANCQAARPLLGSVYAKGGVLYATSADRAVELTSGPGAWDFAPIRSPNGKYVAFLRQPTAHHERIELWLMRLHDNRLLPLRRRFLGVSTRDLQHLRLRWTTGGRLLLTNGTERATFDLRGRKIATTSPASVRFPPDHPTTLPRTQVVIKGRR
jgi:hypothetical protein